MLFTLPVARLDLWFVWPNQVDAAAERACCETVLSEEEYVRGAQFRFARDRHVHLLTRALVRRVLGCYLGLAPRDVCFEYNEFGKPNLVYTQRGASHLVFNISHTDELILLGVTCGQTVGVDVENLERDSLDSFADEFMTKSEIDAARQLDPTARHRRHLETWTLKESYIKARSIGLSLPLREIAFDFVNPFRPKFFSVNSLAGEAEQWRFCHFAVGKQHVGAVCLTAQGSGSLPIRAVKVTPLLWYIEPITLLNPIWTLPG